MLPLQAVQILYYMIACICLIAAFSYFTSAVIPFFKDFAQIVGIFLQVGMWMCPILWNMNMLTSSHNHFINTYLVFILKLNPMYYIIEGYRSSFMGGENSWFWQHPALTLYFWAFVAIMFLIGNKVFQKMRPHFSDVL